MSQKMCAQCAKPITANTVTASAANSWSQYIVPTASPFCACVSVPMSPQPIYTWSEEQLRVFVSQEVAKVLHMKEQEA